MERYDKFEIVLRIMVIVLFIGFGSFFLGNQIVSIKHFNDTYKYVQSIANYQIKDIENRGYISENDMNLIKSEIESKGVECNVSGTSSKVPKNEKVFLSIEIYTENSDGFKDNKKNIYLAGIAH
ncbi:MAG: hypothetical protein LKF87_14610 [Clostridium tyrobutyricum]|jgi:hypothetical protein|uniref:hypothetical protein n=1 Tax=Clostridium tyrobutyricum TaxID=1519 RepID=UPI00242FD78A|nr:hypothetical protein [Clostridium tyrobutyricum]MCH4200646.1 hypothetical protein [Clostridium tyrobutyricum]MCH4237544.1 hypothetical protein [Clostridium tyrobutyricum]MCH4260145.1 hypothetical protein [Clostridium tyrobutyricum]MCI2011745.1 hypothetical protein [Clostridium tyrobutyricum]